MKQQAFPALFPDRNGTGYYHEPGMTLRDYFAAKAMSGILVVDNDIKLGVLAEQAYAIADAMMKAREQ